MKRDLTRVNMHIRDRTITKSTSTTPRGALPYEYKNQTSVRNSIGTILRIRLVYTHIVKLINQLIIIQIVTRKDSRN